MNLADHLRSLEEALLTPAIRSDATQLTHLLATEFLEFGSSGRTFNRDQIIAELASEPPAAPSLTLTDFHLQASSPANHPDWALVTYRTTRQTPTAPRTTLRSSTWVFRHSQSQNQGHWQLLFHQGTPIP